MNLIDIAVIALVVLILAAVVFFLIRSKKKGKKCIGCPAGGCCPGCCSGK